jgi:hypothetical protein
MNDFFLVQSKDGEFLIRLFLSQALRLRIAKNLLSSCAHSSSSTPETTST